MPDPRIEELGDSECRELLAGRHLGRLALVDGRGPVILPVNHVVDRDAPVFRTDPGTRLDAAAEGAAVAFEVDAADEATRTGWSVVVRGTLGEVTDPEDPARLRALPLYPWAPGEKARYLRVAPVSLTGRRIRIPDELPFTWWGDRGDGQGVRRARRHLLVAGVVLAYLAAGGVVLALGDRVGLGGWLALHLVLLGAASNAIVVWSEYFAAALLHTTPAGERAALARTVALNAGIVAVLVGVPSGRSALAAGGAALAGAVVLVHGLALAGRVGRALPGRLSGTVRFHVAAGAALLAGMGMGLWLAGGVAGSAEAYLALRLAHAHLNVLGWVGLAVVGTQFTLWPTVLRTRMVPGLERAVRWSLPPLAAGLALAATGLATQRRELALAGLAGYAAGLGIALVPFVRTALGRPPRTAAAWMLGAGMAWLVVAVAGDLVALAGSSRVVELDGRVARLVPAVVAGFALQTLTGALTYLLPVVFGRGAWGNRRLTGILELAWPARVAAVNLGVLVLVAAPGGAVATAGWWLTGLGLGSFVPLAVAALAVSTRLR